MQLVDVILEAVTRRTSADAELAAQRARALDVLELTEADLARELAGEQHDTSGRRASDLD